MSTFDELFKEHNLKPEEREELVWFLAMHRLRKMSQALIPVAAAAAKGDNVWSHGYHSGWNSAIEHVLQLPNGPRDGSQRAVELCMIIDKWKDQVRVLMKSPAE